MSRIWAFCRELSSQRERGRPSQEGGFCSASAAAPGIGAGTRAGGIGAGRGLASTSYGMVEAANIVSCFTFPLQVRQSFLF